MDVIRASEMGMCFGVRDALRVVERIEDPTRVTILGELVHNEAVTRNLAGRGFVHMPEHSREAIPSSPEVLITAHGLSDVTRARLLLAGKTLIDTTCPLVRAVHEAAMKLSRAGCFVVVIGRPGHVEVEGIIGDLYRYTVVQTAGEVACYEADPIGVVCQSTTTPFDARHILRNIEAKNPGKTIHFVDTICRPTRDRQRALEAMVDQVDAVVVVGGAHSNNSRQLARLAESRGLPVLHVQSAADLEHAWFAGFRTVGLTAGTSTLDSTIDEVHRALLEIDTESASCAAREAVWS
jgi:4-hydroxy-3-methylbut-2-en-1-yl diphosphate reductase